MRAVTFAELRAIRRDAVKPPFFSVLDVPKAKSRQAAANRVPKRRKIDWLMVFVWCVAMPFTAGWFWYAIYGLIKAVWGKL